MSIRIIILMLLAALFIIAFTTHFLRKGRMPEKYALLWYFFGLAVIILSLFPNLMSYFSKLFGFESPANMIFIILIAILLLLDMALTIMIAGQKKKTTLLIQELSILKEKIKNK